MAGSPHPPGDITRYNRTLTPEQRTERARAAALAGAAKRRATETMAASIRAMLRMPCDDASIRAELREMGLPETMQMAMMLAACHKAYAGDIESMRFLRDTIGQKPTEQYVLSTLERPVQSLDLAQLSDDELIKLESSTEEEDGCTEGGCTLVALPEDDDGEISSCSCAF